MVYRSEASKWKAYQFSDPFAAGSFYVCNKLNRMFCRPDCDARPRTNLKSEIKFLNQTDEAINNGFIPCESCDPMNSTIIDVNLLIKCVSTVNTKIGFMPPLLDENEELNSRKIKENILESKRANEEQILKTINGNINNNNTTDEGDENSIKLSNEHRNSAPVFNFQEKVSKDLENTSISKNDSDHYRLVDLACRHLALAAAVNVFQPKPITITPEENNSLGTNPNGSKKRRRRGGVLGFKELAAKSKLSAWHFHRVFKSVTGLTPKTYGDKCWEFIKKIKESGEYTSFENYTTANIKSPKNSNSLSPKSPTDITSNENNIQTITRQPRQKKIKIKQESSPSLFTTQSDAKKLSDQSITPPQSNFNLQHYPQPPQPQNQQQFQQQQPITPPNQDISTSFNHLNTIKSEMPDSFYQQVPTFDDNLQELPIMKDDDNNCLNMKAFSYPDLSKFRADSLFNHSQKLQYNFPQNNQQQQQYNEQPQQFNHDSSIEFGDLINQNQNQNTNNNQSIMNLPISSTSTSSSTFDEFEFDQDNFTNPSSTNLNNNNQNNINNNIIDFNNNESLKNLNFSNINYDELEFLPSNFDESLLSITTPYYNNLNINNNQNNNQNQNQNNLNFSAGAANNTTNNDDIFFNDTTSFFAMNPQLATSIGL
ncbi:uncharacterized protein KGF55_001846 [Candida pseudojiufengensis]|uniref:uncharacterized protein n=1 Tax=Candida pseudojiufengensis TaxID=497109 RepID=UPI00222577EC|nr:uncharacterized protein KGF55_001846 [Candida pseudojiufengensis]KAI5964776.1 hypothetical protein KGF55_001846 [Candida pseudojiufengensis]